MNEEGVALAGSLMFFILLIRIPTELIPKCPEIIGKQSICIAGDAGEILESL